MNELATALKDVPINVKRRLTGDEKKQFIKIVETEFSTQATIFDAQAEDAKEKYLNEYRVRVGFDKLASDITKAEAIVKSAKERLYRTGLDENGGLASDYGMSENAKEKARSLREKLSKIDEQIKPAVNQKNKVIARILVADTYGQVIFIMTKVLGNGILPQLTAEQITAE